MKAGTLRLLVAGGAVAAGAILVWLATAVPVAVGAAPGSALNSGGEGLSGFAQDLRARGVLAPSVRIEPGAEGVGISPLPWDRWGLEPGDAVLTVRSDLSLSKAELAAARPWLESGGRLVVVADSADHLAIPEQILGTRFSAVPVRDGAFDGDPSRPLVPDGPRLYQLDDALAVLGGTAVVASPGLAWDATPVPDGADDLAAYAFVARYAVGSGSVLVVGDSHPLTNAGVGERDNAALAQRVADDLSASGVVFIDEGHRSGGGTVRIDLALRAIGPAGRAVLAALAAGAVATAVFPWPRRLAAAMRARLQRAPAPPPGDPVAAVAARHPAWDHRILHRAWGGAERGLEAAEDGAGGGQPARPRDPGRPR